MQATYTKINHTKISLFSRETGLSATLRVSGLNSRGNLPRQSSRFGYEGRGRPKANELSPH